MWWWRHQIPWKHKGLRFCRSQCVIHTFIQKCFIISSNECNNIGQYRPWQNVYECWPKSWDFFLSIDKNWTKFFGCYLAIWCDVSHRCTLEMCPFYQPLTESIEKLCMTSKVGILTTFPINPPGTKGWHLHNSDSASEGVHHGLVAILLSNIFLMETISCCKSRSCARSCSCETGCCNSRPVTNDRKKSQNKCEKGYEMRVFLSFGWKSLKRLFFLSSEAHRPNTAPISWCFCIIEAFRSGSELLVPLLIPETQKNLETFDQRLSTPEKTSASALLSRPPAPQTVW